MQWEKQTEVMMVLKYFLLLTVCAGFVSGSFRGAETWDHFVFAQAWPPGTCADAGREHHTCRIGPKVDTWTIHGLWPSLGETKGPTGCNNSWKFDFSQLANLQNQLNIYWPNLYNDTPVDSFWAHEWDKHGTCCTDLPSTSGEHNYFGTGLMMNKVYNMSEILRKSNIVPSETIQYGYEDFIAAIKNATGFEPVLQCTTREKYDSNGKKSTYHLIDQIQICLDKSLKPISCYNISQSSSHHHKTYNNSLEGFEKGEKNDLVGKRSNGAIVEFKMKVKSVLSIIRRSHHHSGKYQPHPAEPQSSCPKKYKFNYPPIHHM